MKNKQLHFTYKSVWRIIVVAVVFQLIGGAIGVALAIHPFMGLNLWFGCVCGTLPGFALGTYWQIKSGKTDRDWIGTACFLGFLAVVITGIAFGFVLPMVRGQIQNISEVTRLHDEELQQIDIFNRSGKEKVLSITDPELIREFSEGIADAVAHAPNHPRYSHTWNVTISGATNHEYKLHLNQEYPQSVIGYIIVRSGDSALYQGTFESKTLRPWIEKYLLVESAGQSVPQMAIFE